MPATRSHESGAPAIHGAHRALERDHLFISYAWEDGALAEWLVRKLTAVGYRVWCDRFKLLGGENWPEEIDEAIKTRTFRVLALMSRHSIKKPNPSKERQLALTLAKERGEPEFLIPLNIDGLPASELGWQLSTINWIDFASWGTGLATLLNTLDSIAAPRPLGTAGPTAAAETFLPADVLLPTEETIYSNCLAAEALPSLVRYYMFSRELASFERARLDDAWAFYPVDPTHALALTPPPPGAVEAAAPECAVALVDTTSREDRAVHGVSTRHLISALLKKALMAKCVERGLARTADGAMAYFTPGVVPGDKIRFRNYKGTKTHVAALGEQRFGAGRFRYQLGVAFWIRMDVFTEPVAEFKIRIHITDPSGVPLDGAAANARRKKVAKGWWNHEWLSRQLAVTQFLAGDDDRIRIGDATEEQIVFSPQLITEPVTPSINDAALERLRVRVQAMNAIHEQADEAEAVAAELASGAATGVADTSGEPPSGSPTAGQAEG